MALGGKVDDGIMPGDNALEQLNVTDITHHEPYPVLGKTGEALGVACIGELVEHCQAHAGMTLDDMADEVAAYKATAARDNDIRRIKRAGHGKPPIPPPRTPLA